MVGQSRTRVFLAVMMVTSMTLAGCFGGGETESESSAPWDTGYHYIDAPSSYEDPRDFVVGNPFSNETWGNASWTVYGNEHLSHIHI